ncbi:MAG: M23 family metallopeptidase [Bacillota bacterium]|nr:M23 family metallopeptidase [Bacillota bacterium]
MKKLFPEKKISKKGIKEFLNKRGFYIVLILCIAVVGTTAVFVTTRNASSPNTDLQKMIPGDVAKNATVGNAAKTPAKSVNTNPSVPAQGKVTDPGKKTAPGASTQPAASQNNTAPKTTQPSKTTGSKSTNAVKTVKFILPVPGSVSFQYAEDKLVYSPTLEEWTTHSGVDLSADRGTQVKAAADGVVTEVISDPMFGYTVIIEHANGLKTVYSNLASNDMVTPNETVHQGDVIGSVGNTAAFEVAEQPHLHFEVLKNNVNVNPMTYLPTKK